VPISYRDGAGALGTPAGWTLRRIVLKTALPGIVTGLLILGRVIISISRRHTE
jgi:phosphate transport system permease protein